MEQDNKIISSFYTKDTLNPEIWDNYDDVENSKMKEKRHEGEPLVNRKPFAELWQIHGKHYDLDNFISEHPGGTESILLGKGRDCTGMLPE